MGEFNSGIRVKIPSDFNVRIRAKILSDYNISFVMVFVIL
jgi:hypothetical protein